MTEENIRAHLNDCSQHSSKFICRECGMVSENFLVAHALLFKFKILKFLKNYTVASIHQNSFVMNVEWSVKIFL